jgi:hypothetical protein
MNLENDSAEDPVTEISPEQKKARRFVTVWTCLYVIFFPLIFWMALWSILIFDSPSITALIGIPIICAFLCVPLSMLVSIWKMWSHYFHKQYHKIHRFCALPFFMLLFAISVNIVVQKLFLGR